MPEATPPTYATDFIKADVEHAVFLGHPLLDDLMTAVMALGAEVWSNRRRLRIMEQLLEENGSVTREMIENYIAPPEVERAWQKERDAFIRRAFGTFARDAHEPGSSRSRQTSPERK